MKFGKILLKNSINETNKNAIILYGFKSELISVGYFQHLNAEDFFVIYNGNIIGDKGNRWYAIRIHNFMIGIWL